VAADHGRRIVAGEFGDLPDYQQAVAAIDRMDAHDPAHEMALAWRAAVEIVALDWQALMASAIALQAVGTWSGADFAAFWRREATMPRDRLRAVLMPLAAREMA
jgi:hypothetical protein